MGHAIYKALRALYKASLPYQDSSKSCLVQWPIVHIGVGVVTVECLQLFTEADFVHEWGMKFIPTTHLICVEPEQLSRNHDPMGTEYPSIAQWKLVFFSSVVDTVPPQLPRSLLQITESHSCQAEQRSSLPASTCGSGLGRSDTVLFFFFFFLNFVAMVFRKASYLRRGTVNHSVFLSAFICCLKINIWSLFFLMYVNFVQYMHLIRDYNCCYK